MFQQPTLPQAVLTVPTLFLGDDLAASVKFVNINTVQKSVLGDNAVRMASAHELYNVQFSGILREGVLENLVNTLNYCLGSGLGLQVSLPFDNYLGPAVFSYHNPTTGAYQCRYGEFRLSDYEANVYAVYRVCQIKDDLGIITTSRKQVPFPKLTRIIVPGGPDLLPSQWLEVAQSPTHISSLANLTNAIPVGRFNHYMRLVDSKLDLSMLNVGKQTTDPITNTLESEHIAEVSFNMIETVAPFLYTAS